MPQASVLSCTTSSETIVRFTANQVLLYTRPLQTKACPSSASRLSKTLGLDTWRLLALALPTSGSPIRGLQTLYRWFSLTRLKVFARFQCSPTRVRTCLSFLCTVKPQSSPTTSSDGASTMGSGTTNVPQLQVCSTNLLTGVAIPSTTRT